MENLRKKLPFGNPDVLAPSHTVIQDVNKWIFIEGQEIELKHTFLTCELAREWPENISFVMVYLKTILGIRVCEVAI